MILLFPTALLMLVPRREWGTPLPSNLRSPSPTRAQYAQTPPHGQQSPIVQLSALTTYRAHMILMTVLSILAVDFPVFPRSLAKCETYGVSLVGTPQQSHSTASLTVREPIDGLGCGIVCIFARSSFCNTNYQVPGPSLSSTEAKDCQGATENPANMGTGVLTTGRCKTIRLPCESAQLGRCPGNSWEKNFRNTSLNMAPIGIFSLQWVHSPYSKSFCIPSCHLLPFQ